MHARRLVPFLAASALLLLCVEIDLAETQAVSEPIIELPVQLIGFPVIILAVRLSNFIKKLSYSLNPQTYAGGNDVKRTRRSAVLMDATEADRRLVEALGAQACVLERECVQHAIKAEVKSRKTQYVPGGLGDQPDWAEIISGYINAKPAEKQWYLLSVFIGDIVRSPELCRQLSKRRPCRQ